MFNVKKSEANPNTFHIGYEIDRLLEAQHMTRRELGDRVGISTSNAIHLVTRENVDVKLLYRVGCALKYNFFKHFPIDEGQGNDVADIAKERKLSAEKDNTIAEKDKAIAELQTKLGEREKQIEEMKREGETVKIEMKYLKQGCEDLRQANELMIASIRPTLRMRTGQGKRKSLNSGERLMIG